MPELPEVETIKNNLNNYLKGSILNSIHFRKTDVIGQKDFHVPHKKFIGQKLIEIIRHGKYLIFKFSNSLLMIIHLRMTGKLVFTPSLPPLEQKFQIEHKHTHVLMEFDKGLLIYNDVRRFGRLYFSEPDINYNLAKLLNSGPDALNKDFDSNYLYTSCKRYKNRPIKNIILDQKIVAGIGNIYADESLFASKILPYKQGSNITLEESQKLYISIIDILNASISNGGTTFSDYRNVDNQRGNFQNNLYVYGRKNESCYICNSILQSLKIAGRTTIYCPSCQK